MISVITGGLFTLLGLALLVPSTKLAAVGGSLFYLVIAIGVLATGIQLIRKRRSALGIYAVLLVLILIWTIYEVGFDKWQWIPRGALFATLGLWLALPFVSRPLHNGNGEQAPLWQGTHKVLSIIIGALIVLTIGITFYDPYPIQGDIQTESENPVPSVVDLPGDDWKHFGGSLLGQRYSTLKDITPDNIKKLKLAWTLNTGDVMQPNDATMFTVEAVPIKVNNTLYFCTPHNIVIAADPTTGKEKWRFDPKSGPQFAREHQLCRGVSYHDLEKDAARPESHTLAATLNQPDAICRKRIIAGTLDGRLFAMDANTGKLCDGFGDHGTVNLLEGMPNLEIAASSYMLTSPATIVGGLAVIGGSVIDNANVNNPSGVVRAYDVLTGKLVWKFDAGKPEDQAPLAPGQFYEAGSPNAWGVFSADAKLGMIYVPLSNRSPDEIGVGRTPNDEEYTTALVALNIATGKEQWHFRTTYHDVWDRDLGQQPVLIDLKLKDQSEAVPAIMQPTKSGNIFVLDRRTGKAVYPVEEMKVATDTNMPGEKLSPVQPISSFNYMPPALTEASMWGLTPFDQLSCRIAFKERRYDGNQFTPPTVGKGTITYPGNKGVFNYGSVAVDPVKQIMIGTPDYLAYTYDFIERPDHEKNPNQRVLGNKLGVEGVEITAVPGKDGLPEWNENFGAQFAFVVKHFRSSLSLPCQAPPWGTMVGADLSTGKTVWRKRSGTVDNLKVPFLPGRFPIPFNMGMISQGGPLMTAGGVVFFAATADSHFRAYNAQTGEKLWDVELPAGGQSTPISYRGEDGKQYIVLSAGGHNLLGTKMGDAVVAYTLED